GLCKGCSNALYPGFNKAITPEVVRHEQERAANLPEVLKMDKPAVAVNLGGPAQLMSGFALGLPFAKFSIGTLSVIHWVAIGGLLLISLACVALAICLHRMHKQAVARARKIAAEDAMQPEKKYNIPTAESVRKLMLANQDITEELRELARSLEKLERTEIDEKHFVAV
ncbi:MAG: hypothetical protein NT033_07290, partial [Candidatus Omnitrophica bacterium]|nr:hypothetical protein [Candidatus Omnitrophota bacterium]